MAILSIKNTKTFEEYVNIHLQRFYFKLYIEPFKPYRACGVRKSGSNNNFILFTRVITIEIRLEVEQAADLHLVDQ